MLVPENCLAFVNRTNNLELALEHGNHVFVVSAARGSAAVKVNKTLQINASRDFFRMVFPPSSSFRMSPLQKEAEIGRELAQTQEKDSDGSWAAMSLL